ncbi:uncharacterized protein [Haliotis asinina]|uniref:uncharacterized protein n=1 Tax=Haliotis asinina TaxID=109174 RepID=UPI003531B6B5
MAPDGRTANIKMLNELKIRSFMASKMMYEQSTRYSNYAFWAVMVASTLMGVAAANLCDYLPVGDGQDKWVSASKMLIGVVSGFALSFQTGRIFLIDYFEKKQTIYNETASSWQKLEFDIELFLNSIEVTTTDNDIREFTSECIKQRDDICSKSKPEEDIYQKYHNYPDLVIEKYQRKRTVIAYILQKIEQEEEREEHQEEDQQDDPDLLCWSCLPFGAFFCILYSPVNFLMKHVNDTRCNYHRKHFI